MTAYTALLYGALLGYGIRAMISRDRSKWFDMAVLVLLYLTLLFLGINLN